MSASDERSLAAALAGLSDADLAATLALREVPEGVGWRDFFDAAADLLSASWVDRAVTTLPRAALEQLAAGAASPLARERMLLRGDGTPFAAVAARLSAVPPVPPPAAESATAPTEPELAAAAERAFDAVGSLTDILLWALEAPLARTGGGHVAVADRRRLIEAKAADDVDTLEDLLAVAAAAGLARDVGRHWQATRSAESWIGSSTPERWERLAAGFVDSLPEGLHATGRTLPPAEWATAYPLDPDWPDTAALLLRRARRIGLLTADDRPAPWMHWPDGLPALVKRLPAEIDRVYLQADLTAIAPGPLRPALEQRLRRMAVRESRAQASTYRFSAQSLTDAIARGESAETLRGFLGELSLTGIPQPLAYLIDRASAPRAQLRVGEDGARTTITADDPELLATVAVDQALRPLGLVRDEETLLSRAAPEVVYWSLAEARYPVVAVDDDGTARTLTRRVAADPPPAPDPLRRYGALIATLRAASGADAESAWLERELDQAVRARSAVEVEVRLPDGTTRVFTLEATGIGGGRLRGRDRGADVERTLPISSIEGVRPL